MAPLILIIAVFSILAAYNAVRKEHKLSLGTRGRAAVSAMFVLTGMSHFIFTAQMAQMVPSMIPWSITVVYVTGVLEILGAIGLLVHRTRHLAAWALILFLLAVLPANVYAAVNHTGMGGHVDGPSYLWVRIPLQVFFIGWLWFFRARD